MLNHPRRGFLGRGLKFFSFFLLIFSFIPFVSASTPIDNSAMSFNVFLLIAGISLVLLFIGLGANIPFFTIVGFFIIGVLGFIIQAGNLYVPTGDVVDSYVYEDDNVTVSSVVSEKEFELWNTGNYHFIGWFVMIIGWLAAFFSTFAIFGGGE